jgi:hypothetical protein
MDFNWIKECNPLPNPKGMKHRDVVNLLKEEKILVMRGEKIPADIVRGYSVDLVLTTRELWEKYGTWVIPSLICGGKRNYEDYIIFYE